MDKNFLIGRTIDGYTILKFFGQGGFATIYLAENPKTKERVVIKMARSHYMDEKHSPYNMPAASQAVLIDKEATDGPAKVKINPWDINKLLKDEGEALENITHSSWVKIFGKGAYYGIFYLILEYVNGETLGEKIKKRDVIPLQCLIDVIDALIAAKEDGLDYHGDLKPNNIIIKNDNSVKIIDPSSFGLKKEPYTDIIITTPLYNPFLTRDDINSLGIMLYEIATGFLPFTHIFHGKESLESGIYRGGVNLSAFISPAYLNPTLPKRVDDIILRALDMEADDDRVFTSGNGYSSISEMKDDLEKLVAETGLSYLQVPSIDKTEAIMRAFSPYLKKTEQTQWLEKVLKHIINYRFNDMTTTQYTSSETEPCTDAAQPSNKS